MPTNGSKLVAIALVCSVCFMGYSLMSVNADITGTPGYVSVSPDVIIRQGNGVNYSFSEVATIGRLELKPASIQIDNLEIGATTSAGYLSNELVTYNPSSNIRWIGTSTDANAVVTYTVDGLSSQTAFDILVDGSRTQLSVSSVSGMVQFTYSGTWSTHEFIIQKSDMPASEVKAAFGYRVIGDTVYLTDMSYNGPVVWVWNFGDGYGSTDQSPTHEYKLSGVYVITLTVYDYLAKSSQATTTIEVVRGEENQIDEVEGGWSIWISDSLTIRLSAIGLVVAGAIMFLSGMFLNLPIITPKGRKVIGALMMLAGFYYFIFVDNGWMN